jgi:hypothetical protein
VLPVLFDCLGQTELKAAAKLLGIEPVSDERTSYKDHTTPLREWAGAAPANLTRARLAVAYTGAVEAGDWRPTARQSLTDWLDRLGYRPTNQ